MRKQYDDSADLPKVPVNQQTLKHLIGIYQYMMPYKILFFLGLLCLVFSSTILLAFPFFIGKLVDKALGKDAASQLPISNFTQNFSFLQDILQPF
jgi:ABC-type multidrug transport system fused ATPase/permease subunit